MARDIKEVIDKVIEQIPDGEHERLISRLKSFKHSSDYCPPDQMYHWWGMLAVTLNSELPIQPETEWQKEIYRIVTQKEPSK